jgi:hypothetical protein
VDLRDDMFHVRQFPSRRLISGVNGKRTLKAFACLRIPLQSTQDQTKVQIGLINAAVFATCGPSVGCFRLPQASGDGETGSKQDMATGLGWSQLDATAIPAFRKAEGPLLFVALPQNLWVN